MSSIAGALRPMPIPKPETLRREPAAQAFMLLRVAFSVAPIAFGLDKFAEVTISDWAEVPRSRVQRPDPRQRAGRHVHGRRHRDRCRARGRRDPALRRTARGRRLAGIIVSLLLVGGYADIALRDFGLLIDALALARLASAHSAESSGPAL
jgi:hypothetical protein